MHLEYRKSPGVNVNKTRAGVFYEEEKFSDHNYLLPTALQQLGEC
jgi:hypothetical protein